QIICPIISLQTPQQRQTHYGKFIGIGIAGLVFLALASLVSSLFDTSTETTASTRASPTDSSKQTATHAPRWIRANYHALVNLTQLTQSGQTLSAVLAEGVKHSSQKGQLQPFLDSFSRLLPQALETAEGGPRDT